MLWEREPLCVRASAVFSVRASPGVLRSRVTAHFGCVEWLLCRGSSPGGWQADRTCVRLSNHELQVDVQSANAGGSGCHRAEDTCHSLPETGHWIIITFVRGGSL